MIRPNERLMQYINETLMKSGGAPDKLAAFLRNWREKAGAFDREKLSAVVRKNISAAALRDKLAYVSLTVLPLGLNTHLLSEYSYLDGLGQEPEERIIKKVLASAALPVAFAPVEVGGKICIDGGVLDNCPVYPLVKVGFQNILVVHLSTQSKEGKNGKTDRLKEFNQNLGTQFTPEELSRVRFYHVWPDKNLGNLLKINPDLTMDRIEQGYEAASDQLKDFS